MKKKKKIKRQAILWFLPSDNDCAKSAAVSRFTRYFNTILCLCWGTDIYFFSIQIISHVGLCLRGKNLIYERAFVNYRTECWLSAEMIRWLANFAPIKLVHWDAYLTRSQKKRQYCIIPMVPFSPDLISESIRKSTLLVALRAVLT